MSTAHRVVIAVFPGVGLLDVSGPAEVFALANRVSGGRAGYEVRLAGPDGGEVRTSAGVRLLTDLTFDEVAPRDGETVVVKQLPNSFHRTELEKTLTALGAEPGSGKELVLAGFMTHMCVTHTAQGAFNLGYRPAVVAEATATRSLPAPDGTVVPAAALKTAALTAVADLFAPVAPTVDDIPA
ncbi:isochorismatase family protein [Streptomyces sp. NBC_00727]|uniref:isochorismatase family protein n=1 Tax=Streptomyces sp. NBC_00727 TaxID=2903675 RepID=UPI0038699835